MLTFGLTGKTSRNKRLYRFCYVARMRLQRLLQFITNFLGGEVKRGWVVEYFDCRHSLPLAQQTTRKTVLLQECNRFNNTLRWRLVGVDDGFRIPPSVLFEIWWNFVVGPDSGVLSHDRIQSLLGDIQDATYWVKRGWIVLLREVVKDPFDDFLAY